MQLKSTLIGHKFRCFDVRLSNGANKEDPLLLLTASEDGTAKLWDIEKHKCLFTFKHNKDCEVLRVAFLSSNGSSVVTCGADGKAIVWGSREGTGLSGRRKYEQVCSLDHGDAQIYVCEISECARLLPCTPATSTAFDGVSGTESDKARDCTDNTPPRSPGEHTFLLTAADDRLYIWDLSRTATSLPRVWTFRSAANGGMPSAPDAAAVEGEGDQEIVSPPTSYGGPRNVDNAAYIFDAKCSPKDPHKVAVALSDGTIRILNTHPGTKPNAAVDTEAALDIRKLISQLQPNKPENGDAANLEKHASTEAVTGTDGASEMESPAPHATGVGWTTDARSLVVALGDGSILVLDVNGKVYTGRALLCGHSRGCFGVTCMAAFHALDTASASPGSKRKMVDREQNRSRALSWSSDGSICEWDLFDRGVVREPLQRFQINKYPIYSCAVSSPHLHTEEGALIVCAGGEGGSTGGFLGTPVHLVRYS